MCVFNIIFHICIIFVSFLSLFHYRGSRYELEHCLFVSHYWSVHCLILSCFSNLLACNELVFDFF